MSPHLYFETFIYKDSQFTGFFVSWLVANFDSKPVFISCHMPTVELIILAIIGWR